MEDSSYEALYTGVYIFIFIAALTITLFLFKSVSDVAEKAYEFGNASQSGSVLVNVPVDENRYLNGSEVISYVYNYIQGDLFSSQRVNDEYEIVIKNKDGQTVINKRLTVANVYDQINKTINVKSKYILKYDQVNADGKAVITITQTAT